MPRAAVPSALAAAVLLVPGVALGAHLPVIVSDSATVNVRFRFGIPVTCPVDQDGDCAGTMRAVTARAINPYSPRDPRRREVVAQSDYAIPAGASRAVVFRMSGPGMAQLLKTGRLPVRVRISAVGGDGSRAVQRAAVLLTMPG